MTEKTPFKDVKKMEVRRLTENEHFEANLVSYVAFHMRLEDPEKMREESKKLAIEDWGAFSDDGKTMARILNYRFETWLDGQTVVSGGIGGVSTLPEYRNTSGTGKSSPRCIRSTMLSTGNSDMKRPAGGATMNSRPGC